MKTKTLSALLLLLSSPILVFAEASTDHKIEDAAKASYNYRTVLDNRVSVKSQDGRVTLTGSVEDDGARRLAADTVENLPGVVSVDNQLKLDNATPEQSDSWMAVKIRSRLLMKSNVSASTTKVSTNDGVVTLTGTADSLAQKELTEAYAKDIDGVKSVKNEIVVKENNSTAAANKTIGETIDDASITSQVKYALLHHRSTSALKTKVTTTNGVIRVTGDVSSDAEKDLVTKLAGDVRGAKSVTNDMVVKS